MKKSALLLIVSMLITYASSFACTCLGTTVAGYFQRSSFVAKVKIIKTTKDATDSLYHDAEIELITLYKGEPIKTIKIFSDLESTCAFLPEANTTWVVFASLSNGKLSFSYCSGSFQLDKRIDNPRRPDVAQNYKESVELKLETLDFIKNNKIAELNPSKLIFYTPDVASLQGYNNGNRMAVYQAKVNADLSVGKIKTLQKFENKELDDAYFKLLIKDLKVVKAEKPLTKPTLITIIIYYYEPKGKPSFVSERSL